MVDNNLRSKMEDMFFTKGWRLNISDLREYTGESEEDILKVLKEMEEKNLIEFIDCHYEKKVIRQKIKTVNIFDPKYQGIIKYLTNHEEVYISQMVRLFPEKDVQDVMSALSTRGVSQIGARKYRIFDYTRVRFFVHDNPGTNLKAIVSKFGFTKQEAKSAVGIALGNRSIIIREGTFFPL